MLLLNSKYHYLMLFHRGEKNNLVINEISSFVNILNIIIKVIELEVCLYYDK